MPVKADGPHRRYNPLLDEWVLTSPGRLDRPWQGKSDAAARAVRPAYDPDCYLCPGNRRAGGAKNPAYDGTFAFDNDFPALGTEPATDLPRATSRLLRAEAVQGTCRVVCFSPRHDVTLSRMPTGARRGVVDAWADELSRAAAHESICYVQVFENRGELMGCSNPHPHCQVWAVDHVPTIPGRKLAAQRAYLERHGRDLLGDYLDTELAEAERIVCANDTWVALVPFWAVWPFELMVVPRRRVGGLADLDDGERDGLAALIGDLGARYDALFDCEFPYSMGWHGQPTDGGRHDAWRLHAVYLPPLLRSATIRKFLVGYELTAEPQRDLTAEEAATRLRETPARAAATPTPGKAPA